MGLKTNIEEYKGCKLNLSLVKQAKDLTLELFKRAGAVRDEMYYKTTHAVYWNEKDVVPRIQWTLENLKRYAVKYFRFVTPEEEKAIARLSKEIQIMLEKRRIL